MKHTTKKINDENIEITVTLDEADLKPSNSAVVKELAKDLSLPGFRKGKVPADVAKKYIDEQLFSNQVLERSINDATFKVVEKEGIRLLEKPEVEVTKFVPFSEVEFVIKAEVMPPIKLMDYSKIKKKKVEVEVTKEEVDKVIDNIRLQNSTKSDITDRAAIDGDEAWINFHGKDRSGKSIEGAKGTDYPLRLGSNSFIPGFEEEVAGMKIDEEKTFETKFPDDYRAKTLAGQKVSFTVKLTKIKEVILAKLDDNLAQKIGPYKTVADLKKAIKSELKNHNKQQKEDDLKQEIVEEIIKGSKLKAPKTLIEEQAENIKSELNANLMQRGSNLKDYAKDQGFKSEDELIEKQVMKDAKKRVEAGLIIAEIAKQEKISVSKDELETQLSLMAENNPNPQFSSHLQKPEVQRDFHSRMVTQKTLDKLVKTITA